MAKLVYGLSQSLDGYVDHMKLGPPAPAAFRHFIELVRGLTGLIYGRRTYEIMRYWDEDLPDWDAEDREFAVVWRSQPSGSCRVPSSQLAPTRRWSRMTSRR
jgi:dihydrofolate reductase